MTTTEEPKKMTLYQQRDKCNIYIYIYIYEKIAAYMPLFLTPFPFAFFILLFLTFYIPLSLTARDPLSDNPSVFVSNNFLNNSPNIIFLMNI